MAEPPLRVVSTQSQQAIKERKARDSLKDPLRKLAANILRIVREHGHPGSLVLQLEDCVKVLNNYFEVVRRFPEIHNILNFELAMIERQPWIRNESSEAIGLVQASESVRQDAMSFIQRGALQVCASALIGQRTQMRLGENEINKGIRILNEYSPKRKKRRYQAEKAAKLRVLFEKNVELDEKLDARIDKIIKRLAQLKMLKEVVDLQTREKKDIGNELMTCPADVAA